MSVPNILDTTILLWVAVATWVIFSIPLYAIGKKCGEENAWFAFIPILNLVLMVNIAGQDTWWVILFFIPIINIVIHIIVWMGIAEACDKPSWVGVLMLVPCVNWIVPWYLAFAP